jgi:hypothetical protein
MARQLRMTAIIMSALVGAVVASGCGKPITTESEAPKAVADSPTNAAPEAGKPSTAPDKIIVYYFHATRRCPTCLGIQANIEQTINEKFAEETAAGKLAFEELNFEEEANKHFVEQYELSFSTMIVAAQAGGKTVKWENGEDVWEHAHAPEELKAYVEKLVRTYLNML